MKEGAKLAPGFPTSDFIPEYRNIASDEASAVAQWLFENAKKMTVQMFFSNKPDWNRLNRFDVISLRIFAPDGIFNETSKAGYLTQVGENPNLAPLADSVFNDDFKFISSISDPQERNAAIQLSQMVYRRGIRKADPTVKSM